MKIVLASGNKGKLSELQSVLSGFELTLLPQQQLGVPEVEETGFTFIENALIKARHAATITGLPAIADDSGLEIAALGGAPGIYSARYGGGNSADNIHKVLVNLAGKKGEERLARFYCVIVYLSHECDPTPLICQGVWLGRILEEPAGGEGFGYDPIFYVPERNCSAATLSATDKNHLSHRGKALGELIKQLPQKWQQ